MSKLTQATKLLADALDEQASELESTNCLLDIHKVRAKKYNESIDSYKQEIAEKDKELATAYKLIEHDSKAINELEDKIAEHRKLVNDIYELCKKSNTKLSNQIYNLLQVV